MSKWISVKDKLPPILTNVLVICCSRVIKDDDEEFVVLPYIHIGYREDNGQWNFGPIRYWMELPEFPKDMKDWIEKVEVKY